MLRLLLSGPIGSVVFVLTGLLVSLKVFGVLEIPWWIAWFPLWFAASVAVIWAAAYTVFVMFHSTRR